MCLNFLPPHRDVIQQAPLLSPHYPELASRVALQDSAGHVIPAFPRGTHQLSGGRDQLIV